MPKTIDIPMNIDKKCDEFIDKYSQSGYFDLLTDLGDEGKEIFKKFVNESVTKYDEKQERLSCPLCNPNTSYGGSPEYFDQWKIKHDYHN